MEYSRTPTVDKGALLDFIRVTWLTLFNAQEMRTILAGVVSALGPFFLVGPFDVPAHAHSWYPAECCNDADCLPVDRVTLLNVRPEGSHLVVTSSRGSAIVPANFPVRESLDGRMHVCMVWSEFRGWEVLCLFAPPQM